MVNSSHVSSSARLKRVYEDATSVSVPIFAIFVSQQSILEPFISMLFMFLDNADAYIL